MTNLSTPQQNALKEFANNPDLMEGLAEASEKMGFEMTTEFLLALVSQNGMALEHVPPNLKSEQIIETALRQNGFAIAHVGNIVRDGIEELSKKQTERYQLIAFLENKVSVVEMLDPVPGINQIAHDIRREREEEIKSTAVAQVFSVATAQISSIHHPYDRVQKEDDMYDNESFQKIHFSHHNLKLLNEFDGLTLGEVKSRLTAEYETASLTVGYNYPGEEKKANTSLSFENDDPKYSVDDIVYCAKHLKECGTENLSLSDLAKELEALNNTNDYSTSMQR